MGCPAIVRSGRLLAGFVPALLALALGLYSPTAIGSTWEEALLRADWKTVLARAPANAAPSDPAYWVRAHALLVLGRSNEAVCAFDVSDVAPYETWRDWSRRFLTANPKNGVAQYLAGDGAARLWDWKAAVSHFDASIETGAMRVSALHARAVVEAATGAWETAKDTLEKAEELEPGNRDIAASRATLNVYMNDGAPGARKFFAKALANGNRLAVAEIGDAAVDYAQGNWERSRARLLEAQGVAKCLDPMIQLNLLRLSLEIQKLNLQLIDGVAGTTMNATARKEVRQEVQGKIDQISGNLGEIIKNNTSKYEAAKKDINTMFWSQFRGGSLDTLDKVLRGADLVATFYAIKGTPHAPWVSLGLKTADFVVVAGRDHVKFEGDSASRRFNSYVQPPGGVDLNVLRAKSVGKPWPVETVFTHRYKVLPEALRERMAAARGQAR